MQSLKAIKFYDEGRKLQQQANLTAAERVYRKAIKINPGFVEAFNNLGTVLVDLERLKEATSVFRKALKLRPDHPMLLNNLGNSLQLQGENEMAIEYFQKSLAQDSNYADAYNNLGNALKDIDCLDEAVESYLVAIKHDPLNKEAHNGLGSVLQKQKKIDEAIAQYHKVIDIDSKHKEAHYGLGNALHKQGKIDDAIAQYHKVIDIDPKHKKAYRSLGNAMSDTGYLEKADEYFRKVIEIQPDHTDVYRLLSIVKRFSENDIDIRTMESLYTTKGISDEQKMHLAFGLSKAYEDLQKYEKAMEMTLEANRLKHKAIHFSISDTEEHFHQIKNTFSESFFTTHEIAGNQDSTPIFILGMPRSGTSLTEQILASHPDVFGASELTVIFDLAKEFNIEAAVKTCARGTDIVNSEDCQVLGAKYISEIRKYSKNVKHITDKMPQNFLHIGLIRTILPCAKIIHCARNPMDNCLSIFKNYFDAGGHLYSYDMIELGQYYKLYQDLMDHWRATLPGFIYDLRYEALVLDQENETRKLLEYCNLPWDDACLDFHKTRRRVQTASNAQVRKPIYKGSIGLWKQYGKQLAPLQNSIYGIQ